MAFNLTESLLRAQTEAMFTNLDLQLVISTYAATFVSHYSILSQRNPTQADVQLGYNCLYRRKSKTSNYF